MKEINEKEFKEIKGKAVVDFSATWCGPCKMLRPVLEKLEGEYSVPFYSVDVDEAEELCNIFNISSVPCVIFIEDGKEVSRFVGFQPEANIRKFIETNI